MLRLGVRERAGCFIFDLIPGVVEAKSICPQKAPSVCYGRMIRFTCSKQSWPRKITLDDD